MNVWMNEWMNEWMKEETMAERGKQTKIKQSGKKAPVTFFPHIYHIN